MKEHTVMKNNDNLERVLQRHRAFWAMEDVDTPLLSVGRYSPLQPRQPITLADGSQAKEGDLLLPESMDSHRFVGQQPDSFDTVSGDFIRSRAPYDVCWTEAISGCPIRWKAGHVWADPFIEDLSDIGGLLVAADDPWLAKLLEITRLLVAQAGGAYPISQPLMRGPVDIASSAMGDEPFCWAMVDEPERFRRLLDLSTDIFITIARAWRDATPPFQGGYCVYGLWTPGTTIRTQADNAALMSPQLYREFLLPCDARICEAFEYPLIHTHSGVLHIMADSLVDLDILRAVQVSLDYPAPPSVEELLPFLKQVNAHKPLIITGAVTQSELDMLMESLSLKGLCLQVALRSE